MDYFSNNFIDIKDDVNEVPSAISKPSRHKILSNRSKPFKRIQLKIYDPIEATKLTSKFPLKGQQRHGATVNL